MADSYALLQLLSQAELSRRDAQLLDQVIRRVLPSHSALGDAATLANAASRLVRTTQEIESSVKALIDQNKPTQTETRMSQRKFNLSKSAANSDAPKPYEKYLLDSNEGHGLKADPNPGNLDYLLTRKVHKNKDASVPFNKQLADARKGTNNGILEKALNDNPTLFQERRSDKAYAGNVSGNNLLVESYDQRREAAFEAARKGGPKTTDIAAEKVDEQYIGEPTKIVGNTQGSQLENQPDRFKNLESTQPNNEDQEENRKTLNKSDNFDEMVTAALKQADAMLFTIYARAAYEGRDLSSNENQMISDINSAKARVMAAADGRIPRRVVASILAASQDAGIRLVEDADGVNVVENGVVIDKFGTKGEALTHYPELSVAPIRR